MTTYDTLFWGSVVFLVGLYVPSFLSKKNNGSKLDLIYPQFKSFQTKWLSIYYLALAADWLQGPYLFSVYESHGYSHSQIALLYLVGFFSSMIFGTFVGSLANVHGRKKFCVLFGVFYAIGALFKLQSNWMLLLVGNTFSGIGTSLLYSSFEAWMIHKHHANNFPEVLLESTFQKVTTGNGVVAIISSLFAELLASPSEHYVLGFLSCYNFGIYAPFVCSAAFSILSSVFVLFFWDENYGNSSSNWKATVKTSLKALTPAIIAFIFIQSLFEASIFTFVYLWPIEVVRAHGNRNEIIPYGKIFSCFMLNLMCGSLLFSFLRKGISILQICKVLLVCSTISFVSCYYLQSNLFGILLSFFLFEICCGLYYPTVGSLRSLLIPESTRTTLMNLSRIPLNLLVVLVLMGNDYLSESVVFIICASWQIIGLLLTSVIKIK